jgi:hypothetical protein
MIWDKTDFAGIHWKIQFPSGPAGQQGSTHLTGSILRFWSFAGLDKALNIMIESYDKIRARQGCSLGISEMGKDIGLEWREAIQVTEQS